MSALTGTRADIMLVISDLGSGGAQRVVCALASHWAAAGRRVAVATLSAPDTDFFKLTSGVQRLSIGLMGPSGSLGGGLASNARRIWRLRRLLRECRPAVAVGFVAPTAALVVAAAIGTGVRTVAAERNNPARQSFGTIWDALRSMAYRWADVVTANSQDAIEALRSTVRPGRLAFTPNPLPQPADGPRASLGAPTILAVGRLHRQKGLDVLLEAFARGALAPWQLVLLGEGREQPKLEAQAVQLGIADRVRFEGAVADPELYYRAANIFVLASRHEGTSNALMEAMAYGLPVVVSDRADSGLVADGRTGLVTPAEDAIPLGEALRSLTDDAALRARLGAAAGAAAAARREADDAFARWDAAVGFTGATR